MTCADVTLFPSVKPESKNHRNVPGGPSNRNVLKFPRQARDAETEASIIPVRSERASHFEERETSAGDASDNGDPVQKRDKGTRLVRQMDCPEDFLVLAWTHGVTTFVDDVDYIIEETNGENTWVYVVDSGVNDEHWEFQGNCEDAKRRKATSDTELAWLLRFGAVDKTGALAALSQEGDVYTYGINALCADANFVIQERDSDGTSGGEFKSCYPTASFAGLVAYMLGRTTIPFQLGNDITQYQSIAKNYFVAEDGAYVRPRGTYRVAWNGLDGSADTVCPLSLRKRDDPANICASEPMPSSMTTKTAIPTSNVTSNTAMASGDFQSISPAAAASAPTSSMHTKPKSE
ncbi:hypothetical protein OEA41_009110 [Lepraria neglecta]|uniref:Subtilisin n=1 Tax=Lepraria neglecta TaxID=209136 RepID=A0AAD9Z1D6_9LECA|nr:hypothetical protein OEA41_009110 [Lepraria neglecta]